MSMQNERSLNERFLSMEKKMSDASVLLRLGKANELNFFIFDYDPKDELIVRNETKKLKKDNPQIQEFDLFDTMVDLLDKAGYMENIADYEKENDSATILEALQDFLSLNADSNPMIDIFKEKVIDDGKHIVLITGVGKAYPIIRSHTILNNLQPIVRNDPVVMFYPGRYDQKSAMCLRLFDRLGDDNYYRAFPLEERIGK
jgi:hypothetical protein